MTPTPLRKDAARNWDQIVAVGRALVDQGTPLQLNDVARRAGIGVGTVYRHFASPEALLETVATPCLEALAAHGEQALADPDPWRALEGFLTRTVEAQVGDASLAPSRQRPRTSCLAPRNSRVCCGHPAPRSWTGPALPERSAPIWPRATWSRSCAGSPTPYRSTAALPPNGSTPLAATWPPCSGACGSHHPARDAHRTAQASPPTPGGTAATTEGPRGSPRRDAPRGVPSCPARQGSRGPP